MGGEGRGGEGRGEEGRRGEGRGTQAQVVHCSVRVRLPHCHILVHYRCTGNTINRLHKHIPATTPLSQVNANTLNTYVRLQLLKQASRPVEALTRQTCEHTFLSCTSLLGSP